MGDWFQDVLQIAKSTNAQSHNQSSLSMDSTNCESCSAVSIEKNPRISGPVQFKPVLFKGQLYFIMVLCPPPPPSCPLWEVRVFFSDIYCGNLTELLEVNLTILCESCYGWPPGVFQKLLELSTLSFQQVISWIQTFLLMYWFPWQFQVET